MTGSLRRDCDEIVSYAIRSVLPDSAVRRALGSLPRAEGKTVLVAAGKAAFRMARAAAESLGTVSGVVITKYGHIEGEIPGCECFEAGHPIPDENGVAATERALSLVSDLTKDDRVLFLLSGGGSALFERPLVPLGELAEITSRLLACGASITEINTIRKRLSAVKGGRFARLCMPASVTCVALSDVLGDAPDTIACGPACADPTTCADAEKIAARYALPLSKEARKLLKVETPKTAENSTVLVTGSVRELVRAAESRCRALGYETTVLTCAMDIEARAAGTELAKKLVSAAPCGKKLAFIAGGECVVKVKGNGLGGRNQELALSAATVIAGKRGTAVFSVGSDGTDGPTDAAGGYVDGHTAAHLASLGLSADEVLDNNDSYHALKATDGLIITGPTGTNVNDVAVALYDPDAE